MGTSTRHFSLLLAVAIGCRSASGPVDLQQGGRAIQTGLQGIVRRGPIQPVCQVNVACDAPFSARFLVQQDGKVVAQFHSDSAGRFQIRLLPGRYTVVPDPSAPLMSARSQVHEATVGPHGLTYIKLDFDTGIR